MSKPVSTLPNAGHAVVDIRKLRDYCLNPWHEDGKHKARVFASALGLGETDAEWLRDQLLGAVRTQPATLVAETRFGSLYVVESLVETPAGSAVIRSGWIVRRSEGFPRLTPAS